MLHMFLLFQTTLAFSEFLCFYLSLRGRARQATVITRRAQESARARVGRGPQLQRKCEPDRGDGVQTTATVDENVGQRREGEPERETRNRKSARHATTDTACGEERSRETEQKERTRQQESESQ